MKTKLIVTILCAGIYFFAQAQLKQLYNAKFNLNDMCCLNADTVFVCGNGGKLLITYNGGITWHNDSLPTKFNLQSVTVHKTGIGYVSGDSGTFFKTNNYGISWSETTTNIIDNINNLKFHNDSCGYAINVFGSFGNIIYKTQDSGRSWAKLFDGKSLNDNYIRYYTAFGKDTLFRISINGLYVTYNLGIKWDTLNYPGTYGMAWQNSKIGYVSAEKFKLYKTINGGTTFKFISEVYYPIQNITIINDSTLIISGNDFGGIGTAKTANGGKTWLNYPLFVARNINFLNKDTGYLIEGYNIYKTVNGCISTYDNCPNIINAIINTKQTDFTMAPNPMELVTFISLPATNTLAHYKLYNNLGELVDQNILTPTLNQILRGNKPSGIYVLNVADSKGNLIATQKLIIK